ncbi:MAG: M28 family peptidase [Anaerolineales bacterium]|nr:M28 family peptidase [Anaerolineales bacterium]
MHTIETHLLQLSIGFGPRPVGSAQNRAAQQYIAEVFTSAGFEVELQPFECINWQFDSASLTLNGEPLAFTPDLYTLPCDVSGPFARLGSLGELEASHLQGRFAVLEGELAKEPLMPKNFVFWNPEEHQTIIRLLEEKRPLAVLAISPQETHYPPVFEDGDFALPSVTLPVSAGERLAQSPQGELHLRIDCRRYPSSGANVIARRAGQKAGKIVVCAHLDTKPDTPGALDNATGVSVLLALAQALSARTERLPFGLEIIAYNGEDYYSAPGQMAYLGSAPQWQEIVLAINVDGAGWREAPLSLALFECPPQLAESLRRLAAEFPQLAEVAPWPQGDHMLFVINGVPAVALSSQGAEVLLERVIHTPNDTPDLVSVERLAQAVAFILRVLDELLPA